jgi:hypothetical protein
MQSYTHLILHNTIVNGLYLRSLSRGGPEVVSADERYAALTGAGRKGSSGDSGRHAQGNDTPTGDFCSPRQFILRALLLLF